MPDDLASRLDDVIAGLSRERSADEARDEAVDAGTVVPLAERRAAHRRRWPAVLLSAAAVAAIGFGVTQVVTSGSDHDDGAGPAAVQDDAGGDRSVRSDAPESAEKSEKSSGALSKSPIDGLSAETRSELRGKLGAIEFQGDYTAAVPQETTRLTMSQARRCGVIPPIKGAALQPVTYRGRDAMLVLHPASPTGQRVDLYVCRRADDRGRLVDSVTLPGGE